VKTKGRELRARKGFWAPTPDEIQRANLLARERAQAADRAAPARRTSPLIRPWFGMAKGTGGNTRVTFVWEPAARCRATVASTPRRASFRGHGRQWDDVVRGAGAAHGRRRLPTGWTALARAVFEVPPGRIRLEMSIEDAAASAIDTDVRDLLVGDLRAPVAIGTPEVLREDREGYARARGQSRCGAGRVAPVQPERAARHSVPVYAPGRRRK
jgi:hypothetical protein